MLLKLRTNCGSVAHSSSGPGHLPLKEETTGSNPVCATNRTLTNGPNTGPFPLAMDNVHAWTQTRASLD